MEDIETEHNSKKRARVDPDLDSSESAGVDSEGGPESNSPEAKRIRYDLFDILDGSDPVSDRDPEILDLDSVIKSFQEEILQLPSPAVADKSSDSGESQPELGYLLEASDDELGLPPAISPSNEQATSEPIEVGQTEPTVPFGYEGFVWFDDDVPSYDSFGLGIVAESGDNGDMNSEFVTLGGLFDFEEESDYSDLLWRPESLPAL